MCGDGEQTDLPRGPRGRDSACLVIVAHQGPAAVLGAQEPIHQHGPPKGKMELDVLLKVSTQLVTVQVIAEGEALPGDQHVYLTPHRHRKEGFQTICQEQKQGESTSAQPPRQTSAKSATTKDADGSAPKPGLDERACGTASASLRAGRPALPRGMQTRLQTC